MSKERENLVRLSQLITNYFNASELRDVSFDLGIEYEALSGSTKSSKARELISFCERRGRLPELIELIRQNRPHVAWPEYKTSEETPSQLLATLPLDTIPEIAPLPTGSRVPLKPNPQFVGGQSELLKLARMLKAGGIISVQPAVTLAGLAGIGKTQLALEFVHRYGQYFAGGVFWLNFADPSGIRTEVAECGSVGSPLLDLPTDYDVLPIDEQARLVRIAWQVPIPRLLVFDQCEDPALLSQWRPSAGGCRVLVTSRHLYWKAYADIEVLRPSSVLERSESIELLHKFRSDLSSLDAELIAAELDDSPLGLQLAGRFLAVNPMQLPAEYFAQLIDHALAENAPGVNIFHSIAVNYELLNSQSMTDRLALDLLARAACFAPGEPIPYELLSATLDQNNLGTQPKELIAAALEKLISLGLLQVEHTHAGN